MKVTLDYVAGIIDGEGTITMSYSHRTSKWRTPVVSVSSTTIEILDALVDFCGGHICKHKVYKKHHTPCFSWRLRGQKAITLCAQLKTLLLVPEKRRRATLVAENYSACTLRSGQYTRAQARKKAQLEHTFFHPSEP
mgnify:CR=1 FL=1